METLSRLKAEHALLDIAQLNGPNPGWLVKVPSATHARKGIQRRMWAKLREALGDDFKVIPALGDPRTGYSFPTGYLSMRFELGATKRELEKIARQHKLKFVRREAFTKKEALFEPDNAADVYLPALREEIAKDETVDDVWLDTESVYMRG
jgi:hypothetical protein